jgi:hypothetical protein
MTVLSKAVANWQKLPEPLQFAVREQLRSMAERAVSAAESDAGFAKAWRAEARALRVVMRLLRAAEKKALMLMNRGPITVSLLCLKHRRDSDGLINSDRKPDDFIWRLAECGPGWSTCMQFAGHDGDCLFVSNDFLQWNPPTDEGTKQ